MLIETLKRHWWVSVLRGIAAVVFGVMAFVYPGLTAAVLVLLFGAWVLVDGIFRAIGAIAGRLGFGWGFHLVIGIIGLSSDSSRSRPDNGAGAGHLYRGLGAYDWRNGNCAGNQAAPGNQRRMVPHPYGPAFNCVRDHALVNPLPGALALVWLIGSYAIVFGVLGIILGFRLRT
jgi:hypothetical protein